MPNNRNLGKIWGNLRQLPMLNPLTRAMATSFAYFRYLEPARPFTKITN
jgi:hypothetical protein